MRAWKRSSRHVWIRRRSVSTAVVNDKKNHNVGEILRQVLPQDFVKFGMIPEIIGRVPMVVSLDQLDREALIRILKEPKNSIIKQYQKLFEMDGVELAFEDDAIEAVADKTLERKTGARGLRAIMEKAMMDIMYNMPSDENVESCTDHEGRHRRKRRAGARCTSDDGKRRLCKNEKKQER